MEYVLDRLCSLQNVFSIERVLYRLCSLQNVVSINSQWLHEKEVVYMTEKEVVYMKERAVVYIQGHRDSVHLVTHLSRIFACMERDTK